MADARMVWVKKNCQAGVVNWHAFREYEVKETKYNISKVKRGNSGHSLTLTSSLEHNTKSAQC